MPLMSHCCSRCPTPGHRIACYVPSPWCQNLALPVILSKFRQVNARYQRGLAGAGTRSKPPVNVLGAGVAPMVARVQYQASVWTTAHLEVGRSRVFVRCPVSARGHARRLMRHSASRSTSLRRPRRQGQPKMVLAHGGDPQLQPPRSRCRPTCLPPATGGTWWCASCSLRQARTPAALLGMASAHTREGGRAGSCATLPCARTQADMGACRRSHLGTSRPHRRQVAVGRTYAWRQLDWRSASQYRHLSRRGCARGSDP